MSGPFYGSLAASASVFVAILTALLVNNYVEIKSDRRQTEKELNRVEEELDALQNRKEEKEAIIDPLIDKRESDYMEKAEEQVEQFMESIVFEDLVGFDQPIEKLTADELYQNLLEFHDCESPEELEEEPVEYRHRDVLKGRLDEIEDRILDNIIPSFAADYEGEGWESDYDSDFNSLAEAIQEEKEGKDDADDTDAIEEPDIEVKAEMDDSDVLELGEFIEEYKREYDLDSLDEKTVERLEKQYNTVVDQPPTPERPPEGYSGLLRPDTYSNQHNPLDPLYPSSSFQQSVADAAMAAEEAQSFSDPLHGIDFGVNEPILGLNSQEKQKLEEADQELRNIEIEIKTLQQRKDRLKREKERLHPEDLVPTLAANGVTIILSVVIPTFAYLLFTTNTTITVPSWAWIITHTEVSIFLFWLLGLFVVFESIYARMNDREPKAYSLYKSLKSHLPQRQQ